MVNFENSADPAYDTDIQAPGDVDTAADVAVGDDLSVTDDVSLGAASTSLVGFYGATGVDRAAALTPQKTTITFTAPGTPDYALQDLTNSSAWGFADGDEARTFVSVVHNLQVRVAELEAALIASTGVGLISNPA